MGGWDLDPGEDPYDPLDRAVDPSDRGVFNLMNEPTTIHPIRWQTVLEVLDEDDTWQYRSTATIKKLLETRVGHPLRIEDVRAVLIQMRQAGSIYASHTNAPNYDFWGVENVPLEHKVAEYFCRDRFPYVAGPVWATAENCANRINEPTEKVQAVIESLYADGKLSKHRLSTPSGSWCERSKGKLDPMEMSKEERLAGEQELWDKAHPLDVKREAEQGVVLDPVTFEPRPIPTTTACPTPCPPPMEDAAMCESASEGFMLPQHRRQHRHNLRGLAMLIDRLPTNLIVKAMSDAIAHVRQVAVREHIKADRIERVNQFVVSLRRQFGYMGEQFRTEREFLSAQLARKEVWYDVGVLNPPSISGINGMTSTSLKPRDVENWLAQAEAMTPSHGDLKAQIERDLEVIKGSILVAESCNKNVGEINRNADNLMVEMAALAADM